MARDIAIPKLGMTMKEAKVVAWMFRRTSCNLLAVPPHLRNPAAAASVGHGFLREAHR